MIVEQDGGDEPRSVLPQKRIPDELGLVIHTETAEAVGWLMSVAKNSKAD